MYGSDINNFFWLWRIELVDWACGFVWIIFLAFSLFTIGPCLRTIDDWISPTHRRHIWTQTFESNFPQKKPNGRAKYLLLFVSIITILHNEISIINVKRENDGFVMMINMFFLTFKLLDKKTRGEIIINNIEA